MSRALVTTLAALALSACTPRTDTAPPEPAPASTASSDVRTTLARMGNFSTFLLLVEHAAQSDLLVGPTVTVFAPSDEAFRTLPAGQLDALMRDPDALLAFVRYHIVSGRHTGRELVDLAQQKTMSGAEVRVTTSAPGTPERLMIGQAIITTPDLEATNGMIHVIDTPLVPPPDQPPITPPDQP